MDKDDIYFLVGTALALLAFFGVDYQLVRGRLAMASNSRLKAIVTPILILASLAISSYGFYFNRRSPSPDQWQYERTHSLEDVSQKHFENEEIQMDGKAFHDDTFNNVTFLYDGLHPVTFSHNRVTGHMVLRIRQGAQATGADMMQGFFMACLHTTTQCDPNNFFTLDLSRGLSKEP